MSVAPELPTTLNDREALRLPDGNDLYLQLKVLDLRVFIFTYTDISSCAQLNTCHVFPGDVDPVRFRQALAKTLARFPHAAGRLRHDEQGWRVSRLSIYPHFYPYLFSLPDRPDQLTCARGSCRRQKAR